MSPLSNNQKLALWIREICQRSVLISANIEHLNYYFIQRFLFTNSVSAVSNTSDHSWGREIWASGLCLPPLVESAIRELVFKTKMCSSYQYYPFPPKGTFQKLLSGFCPLRGGYPPCLLSFFEHNDCPLRGGVPPNSVKKKIR